MAVAHACVPHAVYGAEVVRIAKETVGEREATRNRSALIDRMVSLVGLDPSGRHPWCMAAIYWWHWRAAENLGGTTSCPRTAGAVKSWHLAEKTGALTFRPHHVLSGALPLAPGDQFIRVRNGRPGDVQKALQGRLRPGHTGLVSHVDADGTVHTIEGNTNEAGSREGDGVYEKTMDLHSDVLVGFVRHELG